jgi:murein L,D-transpeptidase YcbB/YkuD
MILGALLGLLLFAGEARAAPAPDAVPDPASASLSPRQAEQLRSVLKEAPAQGLPPLLPEDGAAPSQDALKEAALRYARAEQGVGAGLDPHWAMERPALDMAAGFAEAVSGDRLADWLAALPPPFEHYRQLMAGLAAYRAIAASGGWPLLPERFTLKPGRRAPEAAALRGRLAAEGYSLEPTDDPARFDQGLREALALFQSRHGLAATGLPDKPTLIALNVPVAARVEQIEANLERWRWVPRKLPPRRIEINVADATLRLLKDGAPVLAMRVIVGRPKDPTPILADAIASVTFNPAWLVPPKIASREILPKAKREPGYLEQQGFVFLPDRSDPRRQRLEQRPGPLNALGKLRFNLANPYAIYLHDTPDRKKFDRASRQLSHGCVRLADPQGLLMALIADEPGLTPEAVEADLAKPDTRRVPFTNPMPVYLFYWTAFADEAGNINFRADSYGWDAALIRGLAAM